MDTCTFTTFKIDGKLIGLWGLINSKQLESIGDLVDNPVENTRTQ